MSTENETVVTTTAVQAAQAQDKTETATVIDFKMVTFSLADKDYSIDIMHVKEIAKAGHFTYVPNTLPFVLGVYNLRGEIIPILDLRLFFNIEVPPREGNKLENMLILSVDDQKFGVVVDKIDKVIGVQKSTIQPPLNISTVLLKAITDFIFYWTSQEFFLQKILSRIIKQLFLIHRLTK